MCTVRLHATKIAWDKLHATSCLVCIGLNKTVSSNHSQDTESVKLEDTISHDAQILRKEAWISCHHDPISNYINVIYHEICYAVRANLWEFHSEVQPLVDRRYIRVQFKSMLYALWLVEKITYLIWWRSFWNRIWSPHIWLNHLCLPFKKIMVNGTPKHNMHLCFKFMNDDNISNLGAQDRQQKKKKKKNEQTFSRPKYICLGKRLKTLCMSHNFTQEYFLFRFKQPPELVFFLSGLIIAIEKINLNKLCPSSRSPQINNRY